MLYRIQSGFTSLMLLLWHHRTLYRLLLSISIQPRHQLAPAVPVVCELALEHLLVHERYFLVLLLQLDAQVWGLRAHDDVIVVVLVGAQGTQGRGVLEVAVVVVLDGIVNVIGRVVLNGG